MSTFSRGGSAARLVALVIALVALALVREHQSSAPTFDDTAATGPVAEPPVAQVVVPGGTLRSVPQRVLARPEQRASKHKRIRAKKRAHHRRHAASSKARRHGASRKPARTRPARVNPWRHGGGRDIGWPQCPRWTGNHGRHGLGQPMPDPGVRFVVIGVTNGRGFTPSPCLRQHLRWVREHHLHAAAYAFLTYPTRAQLRRHRASGPYDGRRFLGALGNAGYATARHSIRVMQRHDFVTPHVWLDVEPSSSRPWSGRRSWNARVVRGWVQAFRDAGYTVGFYSTVNLWHDIVGGLRLGLPEWRTAGPSSPRAALGRCHERSFQGGRPVLAQWWTKHRDFDRICPGARGQMARYFHKW